MRPSRETACPRRPRSNTPLQALVTLNDPQFVEAARCWRKGVARSARDDEARLDLSGADHFEPSAGDRKRRRILERSRQTFAQRFQSQPQDAQSVLTVGETRSRIRP